MPALHHRSCWSLMRDPTPPQWPTAPRGVAASVKVSSSLDPRTHPRSSHRGQFSWVEACWCTAVPWVISCHAVKTQHMTSFLFSLSNFSLRGTCQTGCFEGSVGSKRASYMRGYKSLPISIYFQRETFWLHSPVRHKRWPAGVHLLLEHLLLCRVLLRMLICLL